VPQQTVRLEQPVRLDVKPKDMFKGRYARVAQIPTNFDGEADLNQ
jgi:hypothetical protein